MKRFWIIAFLLFVTHQVQAADSVVVVLDASGSMQDTMRSEDGSKIKRMDAAKVVLKKTLLNLPEGTNVGIVVFPHQGWVYPLGKVTSQLSNVIDNIRPRGGTPLGSFMKHGVDALLEARKSNPYGVHRLLIVTDGEANDSQTVTKNMDLILARGVIVNTIGVGMESDHQLALKSHSYANAANPKALLTAVQTALTAEISGDDKTSQIMFDAISLLSDDSVGVILTSITKVQNHPLGEQPPVPVVKITVNGVPADVAPPLAAGEMNGTISFVLCVIAGIFIVICLGGILLKYLEG